MQHKKLASRIAKLREEKGLTQLELSHLLGVTENTVANWEKGRSGLEWFERIAKLCKLFNCKPDELIEYIPSSQPMEKRKNRRSLEELRKLLYGADEQYDDSQQNSESTTVSKNMEEQ